MTARLEINGKIYDTAALDQVSLKDILTFEQQTAEMGKELSWDQIEAWARELEALQLLDDEDAWASHPGAKWLTAVTIWASRRAAGEAVSFAEAVDIKLRDFRFVPDPADRKSPQKARPVKKASKKASGRAAASRPAAASSRSGTSATRSATG